MSNLNDLFGLPPDQVVAEVEEPKEKSISFFDIVNSINYSKDFVISDENRKAYNRFMINRALSMSQETIYFSNEMNGYPNLTDEMHLSFLTGAIRKRKRFNKWPKGIKNEDVEVIKFFMKMSTREAMLILPLLSQSQLKELNEHMLKIKGK